MKKKFVSIFCIVLLAVSNIPVFAKTPKDILIRAYTKKILLEQSISKHSVWDMNQHIEFLPEDKITFDVSANNIHVGDVKEEGTVSLHGFMDSLKKEFSFNLKVEDESTPVDIQLYLNEDYFCLKDADSEENIILPMTQVSLDKFYPLLEKNSVHKKQITNALSATVKNLLVYYNGKETISNGKNKQVTEKYSVKLDRELLLSIVKNLEKYYPMISMPSELLDVVTKQNIIFTAFINKDGRIIRQQIDVFGPVHYQLYLDTFTMNTKLQEASIHLIKNTGFQKLQIICDYQNEIIKRQMNSSFHLYSVNQGENLTLWDYDVKWDTSQKETSYEMKNNFYTNRVLSVLDSWKNIDEEAHLSFDQYQKEAFGERLLSNSEWDRYNNQLFSGDYSYEEYVEDYYFHQLTKKVRTREEFEKINHDVIETYEDYLRFMDNYLLNLDELIDYPTYQIVRPLDTMADYEQYQLDYAAQKESVSFVDDIKIILKGLFTMTDEQFEFKSNQYEITQGKETITMDFIMKIKKGGKHVNLLQEELKKELAKPTSSASSNQ